MRKSIDILRSTDYLSFGWDEVEAALDEISRRTADEDWDDHREAEVVSAPRWIAERSTRVLTK